MYAYAVTDNDSDDQFRSCELSFSCSIGDPPKLPTTVHYSRTTHNLSQWPLSTQGYRVLIHHSPTVIHIPHRITFGTLASIEGRQPFLRHIEISWTTSCHMLDCCWRYAHSTSELCRKISSLVGTCNANSQLSFLGDHEWFELLIRDFINVLTLVSLKAALDHDYYHY